MDQRHQIAYLAPGLSLEEVAITWASQTKRFDIDSLALIFISRGLFLENLPILPRVTRDSWRIYSRKRHEANKEHTNISISNPYGETFAKLLKSQPMKSYLKLSLQQLMNFLLKHGNCRQPTDISRFVSFVNELRTSFGTMCFEDRNILKRSCGKKNSHSIMNNTYSEDAAFLVNWSIIEGAKYCICHKMSPDLTTNQFLNLIQREIQSSLKGSDKISRRFLINLLQNIDKFLQDKIDYSSIFKHTFQMAPNIEKFYEANGATFQLWLSKCRRNLANICLTSDDFAECWRIMSIQMNSDLITKYLGTSDPLAKEPSFKETLMSMDSKNWQNNLNLFALSAKQLEDINVLIGLKTLTQDRRLICEYRPIEAIISNLRHTYEKTLSLTKDEEDLGDQILVELITACIELDIIEANSRYIDQLKSEKLRNLYKKYLASRSKSSTPISQIRLEEIENWLGTWTSVTSDNDDMIQPASVCLDVIVPTCLNIISKAPEYERAELISKTEWLISQDFIAQTLFTPTYMNWRIKIYSTLLDLMKGKSCEISQTMIDVHKKDLAWCNALYLHLSNLGLIDKDILDRAKIDLISLNSAKFHAKCENFTRAYNIAEHLNSTTKSGHTKILSSIMLIKKHKNHQNACDSLLDLASKVKDYTFDDGTRNDINLKILRHILKPFHNGRNVEELQLLDIIKENGGNSEDVAQPSREPNDYIKRWGSFIENSSLESQAKTLAMLSTKTLEQLRFLPANDDLLNLTFNLDLRLLEVLCQINSSKYESKAIGCAVRIVEQIVANGLRLNDENFDRFSSKSFIDATIGIWMLIKTTLISVISYQTRMVEKWQEQLVNIMCQICRTNPYILLYSIIVNRLDLKNELNILTNKPTYSSHYLDPSDLDVSSSHVTDKQETSKRVERCNRKLKFWNRLLEQIKSAGGDDDGKWVQLIQETESFLIEIRKISYLRVEYLKTLTLRIPKKLNSFLEFFIKQKNAMAKGSTISNAKRMDDIRTRLQTVCSQSLKSIDMLLNYGVRAEAKGKVTMQDDWFMSVFETNLKELRYRIELLLRKESRLVFKEVEQLVRSITGLLALCRTLLHENSQASGQKMFMEMISPYLSRMKPSIIPLPDSCDMRENIITSRGIMKKEPVTIHKIAQTVNLIASKTSPKKLRFTGSDGRMRSFLLKAHEDLRLDQLVMEFAASVNKILAGNKTTHNKYSIRRYSVTPVSFRSGLIQWVDAPSLCSSYRAWLNGAKGRKVVNDVFDETCNVLCDDRRDEPKETHTHCQPPHTNIQANDMFYQILWSKVKLSGKSIAREKPSFSNILKFRTEFDGSTFENIMDQMCKLVPKELISNQLWFSSTNAHSYWLKTREFTNSCAVMSMVGYVIGLGDRHPENILLDSRTGQVIHIDYNICFEFGKSLSIPEQVPFRLTPNIIHAFGFAGLEGGFKLSCRDILEVLRRNKNTLLYLLNPLNFGFMVKSADSESNGASGSAIARTSAFLARKREAGDDKLVIAPPKGANFPASLRQRIHAEMDMCSQESAGLGPGAIDSESSINAGTNVNDLLMMSRPNSSTSAAQELQDKDLLRLLMEGEEEDKERSKQEENLIPSFEFQHNIKTPTMIVEKTARVIHERIRDKLSGTDDWLRYNERFSQRPDVSVSQLLDLESNTNDEKSAGSKSSVANTQPLDLILLNDAQTTKEQVEALILDALSSKNKAIMFEGWAPWV